MGMTASANIAEIRLALCSGGDVQISASPCASENAALDQVTALIITDDMTADYPISMAELEAIETYLADVLDMVLAGDKDAPSALHCHKRMR